MINTRVDLKKLVITCLVPVTALLIHNIVYLAGTRICDLTGSQTDSVGSITSCISYILCICISAKLSSSQQSAQIAKEMLNEVYPDIRVEILNSLSCTLMQGSLCVGGMPSAE